MNDEEAFQAALDVNPADHLTRGVFGDWLCDRDGDSVSVRPGVLDRAWFHRIVPVPEKDEDGTDNRQLWWVYSPTRRAVEDAAALAWVAPAS